MCAPRDLTFGIARLGERLPALYAERFTEAVASCSSLERLAEVVEGYEAIAALAQLSAQPSEPEPEGLTAEELWDARQASIADVRAGRDPHRRWERFTRRTRVRARSIRATRARRACVPPSRSRGSARRPRARRVARASSRSGDSGPGSSEGDGGSEPPSPGLTESFRPSGALA